MGSQWSDSFCTCDIWQKGEEGISMNYDYSLALNPQNTVYCDSVYGLMFSFELSICLGSRCISKAGNSARPRDTINCDSVRPREGEPLG